MDRVDPFSVSHWESLDYSQEHAVAMTQLSDSLIDATFELIQLSQTAHAERATETVYIGIDNGAASAIPEGSILPDALLLPLWKHFAGVLGSLATRESVSLSLVIRNVQLSKQMLSILEPALKLVPLKNFGLENNQLGRHGIKFMTIALKAKSSSIGFLALAKNEIVCGLEALSLVEAATKHPRLQSLRLQECGIDCIIPIVPEIVPALLSLRAVRLAGNNLGSWGASLISRHLATNPSIKDLYLNDNLFNDDSATWFARSLRTNTTLNLLNLRDNNFTDAGFKTLYKSVYDKQSPNAIYDSNHTCVLDLFDNFAQAVTNGIDEAVLMNVKRFDIDIFPESLILQCARTAAEIGKHADIIKLLQIEGRKKEKMLRAIQGGNTDRFNMQWIESIPLELMPKVLVFLQESGKYAGTEERSLDRLFQVIRARQEVTSFHGVPETGGGARWETMQKELPSKPLGVGRIQYIQDFNQLKKRRVSCHQSN